MEYISVAKMAEKWGLSERSVRNYCAHGRIADAKLIGKISIQFSGFAKYILPMIVIFTNYVNKNKTTPFCRKMSFFGGEGGI